MGNGTQGMTSWMHGPSCFLALRPDTILAHILPKEGQCREGADSWGPGRLSAWGQGGAKPSLLPTGPMDNATSLPWVPAEARPGRWQGLGVR